jgi:uncharacterized protein (TIGR00269 family)
MQSKCSKCGQPAVYLRCYTSESLCKSCLVKTTVERVRRTITKNQMLREDDRIVVGVSGGKDSATLLDTLARIESDFPKAELIPVIIDEGIQGYRDKGLDAARELTSSLNLKLEVRSFKQLYDHTLDDIVRLRPADSIGACSYCGVLRRRALNTAALELDADVVATGHNMDDEAQTILMNIIRGDSHRIVRTSRTRDQSIKGFVPRVKPVSELSTRDTVAYAYHIGLPYHDIPCPYASEALRNDLRTFANEMEHKRPGTLLAILHSGEVIAEAMYEEKETSDVRVCESCGEPTSSRLCRVCALLQEMEGW